MSTHTKPESKYLEGESRGFSGKVFAGLLLLLLGWFAWIMFFGAIGKDNAAITTAAFPPSRDNMTVAELALRESELPLLGECESDSRTKQERVEAFDTYLRVNASEDRAIIRGCNGLDEVKALSKDGYWFTLFEINADGQQNNEVRRVCDIEDITNESEDTSQNLTDANKVAIDLCSDVEAAASKTLE